MSELGSEAEEQSWEVSPKWTSTPPDPKIIQVFLFLRVLAAFDGKTIWPADGYGMRISFSGLGLFPEDRELDH